MKIDLPDNGGAAPQTAPARRPAFHRALHRATDRTRPSIWKYDYLVLSKLAENINELFTQAVAELSESPRKIALDAGCEQSPYKKLFEARGWKLETLDIAPGPGVDHVGTVEQTGLPADGFDFVLCTEVIEHSAQPWAAMRELRRILRPGGRLLFSVPHVWFHHPHPADNWRFTQQGVARLAVDSGFEMETLLSRGGSAAAFFQIMNMYLFGALGVFGAPLYLMNNIAGALFDKFSRNTKLCLGFAALCRKPE
ncbi:SAM-dependent methyltransferase [Ereboglobus sp. PH5-5]|uniref:class I SAM-dependent methyltransferase n=1 Tax=unclassified Ereboglobus TaxID=2626932 RepID=UPI002404C6E6|nr:MULTISPECIES: class I SAM-dependent methyltransferase [unclassified Ereboglobus]MDF9828288.1 SAM-dependent methyltransferase [Ereboglobus sp. PH5-10]MDF9834154.1 SAM-dependent methyltransferase [Ereboglobus sp. PH5-5]